MKAGVPQLKISIVEPAGLLYGSEFALLDILEMLDKKTFLTEVILPKRAPFKSHLDRASIPSRTFLVPMAHESSRLKKLVAYMRLAIHWRRNTPDLIYVNQGGILRPIAAIAKCLGIPILCQIQTLEDAQWVSALKSTHNQVMSFVCNSEFTKSHTIVPLDRISMLYYGYKHKGLCSVRPQITDVPMVVGLLGRIGKSKGQDLIIRVAKKLKSMNRYDIRFRFIGLAATQIEQDAIENLVLTEELSDLIEFRGYCENIRAELGELHVMVIPSIAEPFGRVFCEAAEAGLPALVSDSGGLGELSRFFELGTRFPPSDSDALCAKLIDIKENYKATLEEFVSASKRFLSRLDINSYSNAISEIIVQSARRQVVATCWKGAPEAGLK